MTIESTQVSAESVGRRVRYIPLHANGDRTHKDCEAGAITSYNERYVFVRYGAGGTSAATDPTDLVWDS